MHTVTRYDLSPLLGRILSLKAATALGIKILRPTVDRGGTAVGGECAGATGAVTAGNGTGNAGVETDRDAAASAEEAAAASTSSVGGDGGGGGGSGDGTASKVISVNTYFTAEEIAPFDSARGHR